MDQTPNFLPRRSATVLIGESDRDVDLLKHRQPAADHGQIHALVHLQDRVDARICRRHGLLGGNAGEVAGERPRIDVEVDVVLLENAGILRADPVQYENAVLGDDGLDLFQSLRHRRRAGNDRREQGQTGQNGFPFQFKPPVSLLRFCCCAFLSVELNESVTINQKNRALGDLAAQHARHSVTTAGTRKRAWPAQINRTFNGIGQLLCSTDRNAAKFWISLGNREPGRAENVGEQGRLIERHAG